MTKMVNKFTLNSIEYLQVIMYSKKMFPVELLPEEFKVVDKGTFLLITYDGKNSNRTVYKYGRLVKANMEKHFLYALSEYMWKKKVEEELEAHGDIMLAHCNADLFILAKSL
jgi:hypothetical protein